MEYVSLPKQGELVFQFRKSKGLILRYGLHKQCYSPCNLIFLLNKILLLCRDNKIDHFITQRKLSRTDIIPSKMQCSNLGWLFKDSSFIQLKRLSSEKLYLDFAFIIDRDISGFGFLPFFTLDCIASLIRLNNLIKDGSHGKPRLFSKRV